MIQSQAELIKKLTLQLRSLEEEHKSCREECHTLKQQMAQVSVDLATSQVEKLILKKYVASRLCLNLACAILV